MQRSKQLPPHLCDDRDKSAVEKVRYLKALGADVVGDAGFRHGLERRITTSPPHSASPRETPNSYYPDQYSHPANPGSALPLDRPGTPGANRRQDHTLCFGHRHRRLSSPGPGDFLKEHNPQVMASSSATDLRVDL
ncbi:MAG: hypothetical protein WKF84_28125 [Pyrinomonadaceae bacterium]